MPKQCKQCSYCKEHQLFTDNFPTYVCHHPELVNLLGGKYPILWQESDGKTVLCKITSWCPFKNDTTEEAYQQKVRSIQCV